LTSSRLAGAALATGGTGIFLRFTPPKIKSWRKIVPQNLH